MVGIHSFCTGTFPPAKDDGNEEYIKGNIDRSLDNTVLCHRQVKGVSSNVPVLPAGSAESAVAGAGTGVVSSASRDGRRPERGNVGGKGNADKDKSDSERRSTAKKQKRRQEREKHAVVLDEIAPKETGRQATLVSVFFRGPILFHLGGACS